VKLMYLKNVATLRLSAENCIGCGRCSEVCPHRVFNVNGEKALIKEKDRCMECGACATNCPANAIAVASGVGCATAVIMGWLSRSEPNCDCSGGGECC